jgi:ankyrin repeat protein
VEYAVWQNRLDAIEVLVEEAHMDANQMHPDGHWPVFTAVRDNHPEILRYLLSKKPDISKLPVLVEHTVYRNHLECLKVEMEAQLSPNMRHPDGYLPLTTAIRENRPEVLMYLLEQGADPNLPGEGDYTPLFWAARKGSIEVVNALIEKGADPHMVREQDGQSALHAACIHGRMDMVDALLAKGVDATLVDKYEKAPIDYAAEKGHDEIVLKLLENMG